MELFDRTRLDLLKEAVYAQKNDHCFIERERFLSDVTVPEAPEYDFYARLLSDLLDKVSTPVEPFDVFVGRVVEALPDEGMKSPSRKIFSKGHLSPDYPRLLRLGYGGILSEIQKNAAALGTEAARQYAENAETVIEAVHRFALRYAEAAREAGNLRAYEALCRVPFAPAYDLYSALQSIWFSHMIASCYVGSRDYAFGYMDEYLYPYYRMEKENGTCDEDIRTMLAGFVVKTNEICGRHPHNYRQKPVLSHSSKQYILLDGGRANELSELILDAAELNRMAQPTFTVILDENASEAFRTKVFTSFASLTDKMQVYNAKTMRRFLARKGLPEEIVSHPAVSACCTFDVYHHSGREEFYLPTVQIFCKTLFENEFDSKEALTDAYCRAVTAACEDYLDESRDPGITWSRMAYVFDTLLLSDCNQACKYPPVGLTYRAKNIFLPGIATLGDSLAVLDALVFSGAVPYREFIAALKADFVGYDALTERIAHVKRFGNDTDADRYTEEMGNLLVSAVEAARHAENEVIAPSFYSLQRENEWAPEIPATPDGRRAGTPFSENQSPVYGTDRSGITALLRSVSRLPFDRTGAGGLNLTFSSPVRPEILAALVKSYFTLGGLHVGITVLDRAVLQDAMQNPQKYRSLTVRLYGFSEYFITLPEWQQIAVLNRTAY